MIISDQKDAISLLSDAAELRVAAAVETIETHISRIFLAGDRAFKMKRALKPLVGPRHGRQAACGLIVEFL